MTSPLIARLRTLRQEADLTQDALGKRAGISQAHIAKIEMGRHDPRLSTLEKLLDSVGYQMIFVPKDSDVLEEIKHLRAKIDRAMTELSR